MLLPDLLSQKKQKLKKFGLEIVKVAEAKGGRWVKHLGVPSSNVVGITCPPVKIGLIDLPKFGGAMAFPAPTGLSK